MRSLSVLFALLVSLIAGDVYAQVYGVPEVEVQVEPPAPRVEVQTVRPSAGHQWVPGYWSWRRGQHVWIAGHWALAPQPGMVWEKARWERRGPRWAFVEGHWRWNAAQPQVVYEPAPVVEQPAVAVEPPPPIAEVRPAGPPGGVWIPGYWTWNGGHHIWVGGRWSAARAGFVWEPARWERGPGGWRMSHGHWRHL